MNPYLDDPNSDYSGIRGPQDIRKPKVQPDLMQSFLTNKSVNAMLSSGDPSSQPEVDDPAARYKQLLMQAPPSEAVINAMQASRPKREDYEPNMMTKILAAMAGFSAGTKNPGAGVQTAKKMLDQPYSDALDDYNTDNQGKLEAARMQDSAYNRKLSSAQFNLNEDRQRKANLASEKDKETQRQLKQNEDINKIDEGLTKDANEKEKLSLERVRTTAQANADNARAGESTAKTGYYNRKGEIDPESPEKPVDILRNERINKTEDDLDQQAAAKHLFENVPGYDALMEVNPKTGKFGPTDEVVNDPQKHKSLMLAIDQTSQKLKAKNPGRRRYRRLQD